MPGLLISSIHGSLEFKRSENNLQGILPCALFERLLPCLYGCTAILATSVDDYNTGNCSLIFDISLKWPTRIWDNKTIITSKARFLWNNCKFSQTNHLNWTINNAFRVLCILSYEIAFGNFPNPSFEWPPCPCTICKKYASAHGGVTVVCRKGSRPSSMISSQYGVFFPSR